MFEKLSMRARRVIFIARTVAGRQGAEVIQTGHLMEALLVDDQGEMESFFREPAGILDQSSQLALRQSFFSAEAAQIIREGLKSLAGHAPPIAGHVDLPIARELKGIVLAADDLRQQTGRSDVQPLHLVAEILLLDTSGVAALLANAGITRDQVMQAIASGTFD